MAVLKENETHPCSMFPPITIDSLIRVLEMIGKSACVNRLGGVGRQSRGLFVLFT